ncbi:mucin-4-like [Anopheles marshallii]|uniref:mucin-4-like n=1 Tax=Anopheles marshallii TaxID=1521116 RepID=UPI00237AD0ED|nr:mucin-4-like [Anopheles marshallii]
MHCLITVFAVSVALASAGYVEHYQGATSFSSFDLKSSPIAGNGLVHTNGAPYAVKGSTDHAAVGYETKPVISTVYAAPITKTLTYSSAPSHHYVAPVQVRECAHKLVTPVQTSVTYGVPTTASQTGWSHSGSSGSGYQQSHTTLAQKAPVGSYGTSSTVGHTVSHHYSTPASSSIIYTPPKIAQTITTGAYGGSFGGYKGHSQPAPIIETLVDVAPPKLIHAQPSPSYGVPATDSNFHPISQITPVTSLHGIAPIKTTSNYVATGSHATSHQYKAATIPVKSTPAYFIAPGLATSGSASWSEASKNHGHSFTTTHSSTNAQQYLPPKATVIAPIAVTSFAHSSSKDTPPSPSREYLPAREYLPPPQGIKGTAAYVTTGSVGSVSYEVPQKLTVSKVIPQQQTYHSTSSSATTNHVSRGAQYGTAAILSPLHVHTIHKTPVLAYTPKHHCTEDH